MNPTQTLRLVACVAVLLGLLGCNSTPGPALILSPSGPLDLNEGQSLQLEARGQSGVQWASSNSGVAQVNAQGLVVALKVGQATIRAGAGTAQAEVQVRVKPAVALSITPSGPHELAPDQEVQLNAQVANSNNQQVHWVSDNLGVAQVNAQGLVTGKGMGSAILTATPQADPGKSVHITVTVAAPTPGDLVGTVLQENAGAALEGSAIELFKDGLKLASTISDVGGRFGFTALPRGSYTLKARKTGWAGSEVVGLPIKGGQTATIQLIQHKAADSSATVTPPELKLSRSDGTALAGSSFNGPITYRVQVAPSSEHIRPMRSIYVALGRTPGSGMLVNTETSGRALFSGVEDTLVQEFSGDALAGLGSAEGSLLYLEAVAYDFNRNRSHHLVPITLQTQDARLGHTVQVPSAVDAFAVTYSSALGLFSVGAQAAPAGTSLYVEVRWCYQGSEPFAFEIERSADGGASYRRVGRVGGGTRTECPTTPYLRPFFFRDHAAELSVGQTYHYRVVAIGANEAASATSQTTPLAPFKPRLIAPSDEALNVSRTPTFVLAHPQRAIGADGAAYALSLADSYAGTGVQWLPLNGTLLYVEEGTGPSGNQLAVGQVKAFYVKDSGEVSALSKVSLDPSTHHLSVPYNFDGLAKTPALQALRTYAWRQAASFAYKYDGGRVCAYSLHTAAGAFGLFPLPSESTEVFEFTTED
jgi:hypothetical protein